MGLPIILSFIGDMLGVFVGAALVVISGRSTDILFWIGAAVFVYSSVELAMRLRKLSEITSMCMGTRASANSLPGVARRFPQRSTLKDPQAYHQFLTFLNGNPMGVELCGVLINYDLAANVAMKLLVYAPTFYGIVTATQRHSEA